MPFIKKADASQGWMFKDRCQVAVQDARVDESKIEQVWEVFYESDVG